MIDFQNKAVFKLKQQSDYGEKVKELLVPGEEVLDAYQALRDGVVFTTKRIIVLNVQGLTGKKRDYTSIPYSKIQAYSVETAGRLRFEFKARSSVVEISKHISHGVL